MQEQKVCSWLTHRSCVEAQSLWDSLSFMCFNNKINVCMHTNNVYRACRHAHVYLPGRMSESSSLLPAGKSPWTVEQTKTKSHTAADLHMSKQAAFYISIKFSSVSQEIIKSWEMLSNKLNPSGSSFYFFYFYFLTCLSSHSAVQRRDKGGKMATTWFTVL